jgi:exopolysaccharide biosynthesis protein
MHIVQIDLTAPGIRFKLTSPGGNREAVRNTTVDFLSEEHAQVALNAHFFLPFPSTSSDATLIGLAASNGNVYSAFESPDQSYAIVADAPALNIDPSNHVSIVHRNPAFSDGKHVLESVMLWNAVSGSAQIVTDGVKTIPIYRDDEHLDGILTPGGGGGYDNSKSWYNILNARTAIGISRDDKTLVLFTVDRAPGSLGMTCGEVADILIRDYSVVNALNLDGGGSTTLALEDPKSHVGELFNVVSDDSFRGRYVGSNLAVFANPIQK